MSVLLSCISSFACKVYNILRMSIIYAVVARANEDDVSYLCSHDTALGNYPTICQEILKNAKIT